MKKKSIIAFLLFSFTFLMSHDFIMEAVDHQETSFQHLDTSSVQADVQSLYQVHDALDIMVLHFHTHDKPKSQKPPSETLFALTFKDASGNPALLERPPTA